MTIQTLTIIHTNDIHSHFERMPAVASVINRLKLKESSSETLVIDCGDHLDRMSPITEGSDGLANVDVMNAAGYEAVVLGNNEGLTFTSDILRSVYAAQARFAVIGSNLFERQTGAVPDWMMPHAIIRKGDVKIGLIGVTAPFSDFYSLLGWDVADPYEIVRSSVRTLRSKVDLLFVMSHLGLSHDRAIAETIPGINGIFGAHTHHLLEEPQRVEDTYIFAAGKFGDYVGVAHFSYDLKNKRVVRVSGECVPVQSAPDDPHTSLIIENHRARSDEQLGRTVATIDRSLSIDWYRDSPLGNLLAAGLRRWTGADIGIVNAGQIMRSLDAGDVTCGLLHQICPSPINPCYMKLSGELLWQALEQSIVEEYAKKPIRGFGFRGERLGTLCMDGMSVEYDPDGIPFKRNRSIRVGDAPLERSAVYSVGTVDMFTFRIGYPTLSEGTDVRYYLPEFIRDVLQTQIVDSEAIASCHVARWRKIT